ncbi:hypothetical protein TSH58p_12875 [Azospirillum sp. TSH58]|uniref:hypothetical protein n=1 Tax=Azospirillum sp. TSH58 TaxID=664962 RepID=UPI000D601C19|nr:hypothetical protein [Azospirillum sp. TSH58]AWJ84342.1 hypothetical protein TSH58p_12875 [Azospirillum sp. TSH58]PWC68379.1 hypothetical protein TSH58_17330 [Azospirillum sp. TSH58]
MSGSPADAGDADGRRRRFAAPPRGGRAGAGAVSMFAAASLGLAPLALVLSGALMGAATPALAQSHVQAVPSGPPIRLFPPPERMAVPDAEPAAGRVLDDPLASPGPSVAPLSLTPPVHTPSFDVVPIVAPPSAIAVETLGPLDPDGAGPLAGAAGLGGDPWRGIPRAEVLALLPELPTLTPSPAVKELQRRLLLSRGSPAAAPGEPEPARRFGALRVEKLAVMGDPRGAADLAALLPEAMTADEAAARALTDAELLAGPLDCAAATERAKPFSGPYWQRVELFCRLRAGRIGGGVPLESGSGPAGDDLAFDMLREQPGGDPDFLRVAEAMAGGAAPRLRSLKDPSPLTLAALRTLQAQLPPDVLSLTDPARLAAVAANTGTDPATRVTAAERAAAALFLDSRRLGEAYRAAPAKGDELLRLKDAAARDRTARTRALVQQAMLAAMAGGRRVELAGLALELLDPPMLAGPVGAVVADMLDTLSPTPDAAALAPAAARLCFALGRADKGKRWYDLALRSRPTAEVARLWPLAVIALGGGALGPPPGGGALGLAGWLDESLRGADPEARARVAGQMALLQAMGVAIPEEAWRRTTDPEETAPAPADARPPTADPALWQRLAEASADRRVGETALAALLLLGDAGPVGTPPAVVARVVGALRAVGLDGDARAIAREAAAALAG